MTKNKGGRIAATTGAGAMIADQHKKDPGRLGGGIGLAAGLLINSCLKDDQKEAEKKRQVKHQINVLDVKRTL